MEEGKEGNAPERASATKRELTSLLIELYRGYPELRRVKDKDYFNPSKKNATFMKLKQALQILKPDITVDEIKKKINVLRTNFNREYRTIDNKKKFLVFDQND